ncbi:MAG: LPS assembly lipoprotein LptE [Culturomica sp.]|nr:LPS assembly lipoprotein LptE [Culturomica sp.]
MRSFYIYISISLILIGCISCGLQQVRYSFDGASISPDVKTFSVEYFPNKAPLVVPTLSDTFTDKLKNYLRTKTSLKEVTENNGDIRFEGQITEYSQRPMEIQRDEIAASNRLTITVRVRYTNTKDDKFDFDSSFSHYADYSIDVDYNSVEESLIEEITDKIIEDIYNKALVNW